MLKATRYIEGSNPDLVAFLEDSLPFLSFDEACDFYAETVPLMREREVALLGANDRFFLLTGLLNRTDAINEWVYNRCREVEADPDGYLDLWARAHYKTTVIVFAGIIQELLIDPEITICIFGGTDDIAKPSLAQIMGELETNDYLKRIYADVLWQNPRKEAPVWSKGDGLVAKRKGNPREGTVEAHGLIDAMPTGKHYRLRVYDDIINEKLVTNDEMVKKASVRWQLSQNLGAGIHGQRMQHAGTRYSFNDTYGILLQEQSLKARIYPATDNGRLDGKPVFLSTEHWETVKRDQRATVAAQMLLNPLAGEENMFLVDWLRPYEIRPTLLNVYIIGDPSLGRTKSSDRTAIAVIGVDPQSNRYLLDGYCHRMRLSDRWTAIKDLFKKWKKAPGVQMVRVGYERYGLQADTEYFDEKIIQEKIDGLSIDEIAWVREGGQSKKARVGRLEPYFRNSQFWLPPQVWVNGGPHTWHVDTEHSMIVYEPVKGLSKAAREAMRRGEGYRIIQPIKRLNEDGDTYDLFRELVAEFQFFPFAPHDDLIDAMSRIEDMEPVPPIVYERVHGDQPAFHDA